MDASLSWGNWKLSIDGSFLSGQAVTLKGGNTNEVAKAGPGVNGGRFRGLMFTECSAEVDDTQAGSPPTVFVGGQGALAFVRKTALAAGNFAPGEDVLAAAGGFLGRAAAGTTSQEARIGTVQEVQVDGILMHLNPATI